MPRLRLFAFGILCSAAVPVVGRAQEPRRLMTSDSIPTELAAALIASGGLGGDPQILVGSFPGWVSNRIYIPPTARVLGAAFIGQTAVGVMSVPDAPDLVIAELRRELPARGWKTPPPQPMYGGGFRPAVTTPNGSPSNIVLCGDQQILYASAARHRGTTTLVTVRVAPTTQYSTCTPPPMPPGMSRSPFPTLFNPAGANDVRMTGDCWATLSGPSGTGANLRTPMTPEAILSHYGKQLADSGWRTDGGQASIVGRSWTRTDSSGAPIELSLIVTNSPRDSTCKDINMQVKTLRKP